MFLSSNSCSISLFVKVPSTIPSDHWLTHKPHDFFPIITLFTMFGCLVIIGLPCWYCPLSYFLKVFLPSKPLTSNSTSTIEPQNVNKPLLYDCKKKLKISLNPCEYFCSFLSNLLPISSLRNSIRCCLVKLRPSCCPLDLSFLFVFI
jgi:hypothetical protein